MDEAQKKQLLKMQQGELDAVLLYKKVAQRVKDESTKEVLLEIARDEARHASILKKYTGEVCRAKSAKANLVGVLYRVIGRTRTFSIMSKGEEAAAGPYEELVEEFPNVQGIIDDEFRHAKVLQAHMKTSS